MPISNRGLKLAIDAFYVCFDLRSAISNGGLKLVDVSCESLQKCRVTISNGGLKPITQNEQIVVIAWTISNRGLKHDLDVTLVEHGLSPQSQIEN